MSPQQRLGRAERRWGCAVGLLRSESLRPHRRGRHPTGSAPSWASKPAWLEGSPRLNLIYVPWSPSVLGLGLGLVGVSALWQCPHGSARRLVPGKRPGMLVIMESDLSIAGATAGGETRQSHRSCWTVHSRKLVKEPDARHPVDPQGVPSFNRNE